MEVISLRRALANVVRKGYGMLAGGPDPDDSCVECGNGGSGKLRESLKEACEALGFKVPSTPEELAKIGK